MTRCLNQVMTRCLEQVVTCDSFCAEGVSVYKHCVTVYRNSMNPAHLKRFCTQFDLPDLSSLVDCQSSLPSRLAVVWQVMQVRLGVPEQVKFLHGYCAGSDVEALKIFAPFLATGATNFQAGSMSIIMNINGFSWDSMGEYMKKFCTANRFPDMATLVDGTDPTHFVFAIDRLFPALGEDARDGLNLLKFMADKDRFNTELDELARRDQDLFERTMAELDAQLVAGV
jgi:hypothetical protein